MFLAIKFGLGKNFTPSDEKEIKSEALKRALSSLILLPVAKARRKAVHIVRSSKEAESQGLLERIKLRVLSRDQDIFLKTGFGRILKNARIKSIKG